MAHIPRPLYVQHHSSVGTNTSRRRNAEIQNRVREIECKYRDLLDQRCLSLGLGPTPTSPWSSEILPAANACIDVIADSAVDRGTPLTSVVIPTRNRPELLRRALASVLNQTYINIEVLVVGDQCPFVDSALGEVTDPRVRHWNLAQHANDLGATARNYALKAMARGTLIAYLDDDNWWEPDHLPSLVQPLLKDSTMSYAFSSFEVAEEDIDCRRPRRFQIDTSALLHRRSLLDHFGYWEHPDNVDWAHDWELVSRWQGEKWVATRRPTLHYNLESSHQTLDAVQAMKMVADEEVLLTVSEVRNAR